MSEFFRINGWSLISSSWRSNQWTHLPPAIDQMTCRDVISTWKNGSFPRWDCSVPVKQCTSTCWASITLVVLKHRNYAIWWTVAGNWIETWRIAQLGLELDGPTSCKKQLWFLLLVKQWGQSIRLLPAQDALHPASCAKTFSGTGSVHIFKSRQIKFKPKLILTLTYLSCPFSILSAP